MNEKGFGQALALTIEGGYDTLKGLELLTHHLQASI
jgi:hypothetical protein